MVSRPRRFALPIERILGAAARGPAGVALRVGAMALAATAAAWVHRNHDPGVLCPLRAITGVPCPFCGGTTVFIELGSGHLARAPAANPAVFVGAIGLTIAPLGAGHRWWALTPRTRAWLLGTAVTASWVWQLVRFGYLRF